MNQNKPISYRSTIIACYLGNTSMAIVVNLLPVLFIPLREQFGFTYAQLGFLVLINFVTQVSFDIIFSFFVDKYGFRRFIVASPVLMILGFCIFALAPEVTANPFPLFIVGTILYSGACGLLELLLSPIVHAIPTDEKSAAMSVLHAFYCWGQILVVLLTTLYLFVFGKQAWQGIMLLWLLVPLVDFFLFLKVPLAPPVPKAQRQGLRALADKPLLALFVCAILFGGASELGMSQWASAFAEKALGVDKMLGDISGMCLFALCMGIVRALHGKPGSFLQKANLQKLLLFGFALATVCYLVAALSKNSIVGLLACAVTGIAVALLWPGTLSAAAERFPLAGAWMFAILAAGGDIGGALSPWIVGKLADITQSIAPLREYALSNQFSAEQMGLKFGLLFGTIFPLLGLITILLIHKRTKK